MRQELVQFNAKLRAKRTDLPDLQAGDVVKIYRNIKESGKERKQMFQGMVIAVKGGQSSSPIITVRKVSSGVGVELILPLLSSQIDRIELIKRTKARRGKLYYVRTKSAKLTEVYGSIENWEKNFLATGAMRGIGWVVLAHDGESGKLYNVWVNEHDAGHLVGTTPLLVMDVFEHAFAIDYGLKRADYISAFMRSIDWTIVEKRFEHH